MNSIHHPHIFDDAEVIAPAKVSGKWFPIRLNPDVATGEILNIGVGFIDSKHKLHVRLIDSAKPFQCLYGKAGLENFTFLLTAAREHFQRTGKAESPSQHITFGHRAYAGGESISEILDSLYSTMVTLATVEDNEESGAEKTDTIDTVSLRKDIFKHVRQQSKSTYDRMFHEQPVDLHDSTGKSHVLDLPIYLKDADMHRAGTRFGTIVSAHYRSKVHRGFNLDSEGSSVLSNAHAIIGDRGRGGFLILRPAEGEPGYTQEILNDIDNDIDRATWPFMKSKNMLVEVSSDMLKLAEAALSLAD